MTVGVSLHNTLMSIGAIWLIANYLLEARFKFYWKNFKNTPSLWMLVGILLLSVLSLLWSTDTAYGLKDLSRKLPFFVIPLVIGTAKPIDKKVGYFLLYVFIGITVLTSAINYYRYNFVLESLSDIREMSYFISHVRFSTLTALGVFVSVFLFVEKKGYRWLWLLFGFWLFFYTLTSQILNGYVLLFLLLLVSVVYVIWKIKHRPVRFSLMLLILLGFGTVIALIDREVGTYKRKIEVSLDSLETHTVNNRHYLHDLDENARENGNLVWIYVQPDELRKEWNRRSEIDYHGLDHRGQPMFGTLMRYMTSKGLRKDSLGVWSLTEKEIHRIENGVTSIALNRGPKSKLREFIFQWEMYRSNGDPDGHSLLQRAEHLRVAVWILSQKWLTGVGIGDVPSAFKTAYREMDSKLDAENHHRSHNQFLTIWISHGLIGLILFLGMLVIPMFRKKINYFTLIVFCTLTVSCVFQDFLETQAGVTIFGLFYVLAFYSELSPSCNSSSNSSEEGEV